MTRKRRLWILGIGVAVIVAAGVTVPLVLLSGNGGSATDNGQSTYTVERGDIRQTLTVYGSVVPKDEYTYTFPADDVEELLVKVGSRVEEGDILVELDQTQLELALLQAERSLKEAKAEGIPSTIREKELAYQIAQENYDATTLRAPFAGVVTQIVQPTSSDSSWSLSLIDTSELYVEAEVDQLDAPDVAVGQTAEAIIEPLPDESWEVELVEIGGVATSSGNSTVVSVKALLSEADASVLVGYTVEMEILTSSAEDVLLAPITCLIEGPNDRWIVMRIVDEKPTPQPVEIGAMDDQYVEITSGLEEGDVIVPQSPLVTTSSSSDDERMPGGFPGGGMPPMGGMGGMP